MKLSVLQAASYLTDPICKVREYVYTFSILDSTCAKTAARVAAIARLSLGILACALLAPITAPIGAALRGIVAKCEAKPYIYWQGKQGKTLPENRVVTVVSHNECYMPAGYSITDGGVMPPSHGERMQENLKTIHALDPDLVCLYEVADVCDAKFLASQLPNYPFVIPVAGVRAVGPSSMMFVASKYEIVKDSIAFVPFIKDVELTGRAKFSEKGFLSFDLRSKGDDAPFATIVSTHLQHSEIPAKPEEIEVRSRALQMEKILQHIQTKIDAGHSIIFTGDLNQAESELQAFLDQHPAVCLKRDSAVQGQTTWGGDAWCARLMGKPASGELVLDYTLIAGKADAIATRVLKTGYVGTEFRVDATSDHDLLFSAIHVG